MTKPNIVLINCDDLGYGDLGCYGSTLNSTPALDRLATEGMRFTDFYMGSCVCSPSRAAMLTGCYPPRISMPRVLFPADPEGLSRKEETLANVFKREGYSTALVGKWHVGDQPEFLPAQYGFDQYFGIPYSNDMGRQIQDAQNPRRPPLPLLRDDTVVEEQPDQAGLTSRYVETCIDAIRTNAAAERPFFLYLAHMYVHLPIYVPDRFLKDSRNGRYGGAVACIDWAWARLDYELKRLGLEENTIVIFTSDNGSRANNEGGSNAPLRGGKFTTWEGGFRVPLIVRWPGRVPAGSVCREPAAAVDFLPTLAALTGATRQTERPIDGLDLSALWTGTTATSPRDTLAYYHAGHLAALRKGRWKLHFCAWSKPGEPYAALEELYDLAADPSESNNVYAAHPDVVAELTAAAEPIRHELGDGFSGRPGTARRACGHVDAPRAMTTYDPACPYFAAEYDLSDRG